MALFDQTIDETAVAVSDSQQVSSVYGISASDTLSLNADFLALALSYQYSLADTLGLLDGASVELTGQSAATDNVTTSDSSFTAMVYGIALGNSVALTDAIAAGLVKDVFVSTDAAIVSDAVTAGRARDMAVSDSISATDSTFSGMFLGILPSDTLTIDDLAFPWVNGSLAANLSGSATVTAVLLKKAPPSTTVVTTPPRNQTVARPPAEMTYHYSINTSPTRRRE